MIYDTSRGPFHELYQLQLAEPSRPLGFSGLRIAEPLGPAQGLSMHPANGPAVAEEGRGAVGAHGPQAMPLVGRQEVPVEGHGDEALLGIDADLTWVSLKIEM